MRTVHRSLFVAFALTVTCAWADTPRPAAAPVRPVTDNYFGTKIVDNYRYFEDAKNTDATAWMKAQADYTRATLDALPGYPALLKRIDELNQSQPEHVSSVQIVGGRYYSLRTPKGAQSPKLYVRDGVKGVDKLLVDPEKTPGNDKSHFSIHSYQPSPDGRYVAYVLSAGGSEHGVLYVLDVTSNKNLAETDDRTSSDPPFWLADSRAFFHTRRQKFEPGMPQTAKYQNARAGLHLLGHSYDDDTPLIGRGVSDASVALTPTEFPEIVTVPGSRYAVAFVSPGSDPRLRSYASPLTAIRAGKPQWRAVAASYDDQYIASDDSDFPVIALTGDTLYWVSRKNAPRGEILKLDLSRADSKSETVVAQGDLPISAVYAGRDAIYWRVNDAGTNSIRRLRLTAGAMAETLTLPYAATIDDVRTDAASDEVALLANSYLHSTAYLRVDAKTGAVADTGLQPAGPFDHPDDLAVDEVRGKSWDGIDVPMSIVHKKGIKLDASNTAMIMGYGAYGYSMAPLFIPAMQSWYDHAAIIAFAHVRGGGELGEAWHQGGFQATKPNTWKDFIACTQYLVDKGYTKPAKLVGWGQSAGGILIGRAIEERPDLFGAAISRVPLADTLRFETTANGPDNIPEFGSVKTEAGFKSLYAMSSYANVQDGVKYPPLMVYAGANDPRVPAWIPAKYAARMQAATASGKPVLLRVDYDAGHTGFDATRDQANRNTADMLAFALWQLGDRDFQPK